jgi:hypothetical protein
MLMDFLRYSSMCASEKEWRLVRWPSFADVIFCTMITMSNDLPIVTWTPNLNSNGEVRVYTVLDKTNLTDAAWGGPHERRPSVLQGKG